MLPKMIPTVAAIALALSAAAPAAAQSAMFASETLDLGQIQVGRPASGSLEVQNQGSQPLMVLSATPSCACVTASLPTAPVARGAKAKIVLTYDGVRAGPFAKTVTVTTNAQDRPTITLTLKGVAVAGQ
jgi:hypothetical protein